MEKRLVLPPGCFSISLLLIGSIIRIFIHLPDVLMKTAKHYPFPALLRRRLQLYFDNRAALPNTPSEHQFRL